MLTISVEERCVTPHTLITPKSAVIAIITN